jgi:type II secretory pathway component GspD/PulD (secretin)
LLTVDNEEAKIVVGQNVPFVTGSFSQTQGAGAGVNPFQTIERRDVGLTLRVTPQVAEGGTVKLKIFQEVSSLSRTAGVSTADVVTNKRSIESTVLVDDQQTVVLGGLIQDDVQSQRDQVPGLGSIPIIGNFFKYETRQRKKTNLMVFLRPVILRDNLSPGPITNERYDYIRNEQAKAQVPEHWLLPDMESPQLPERDPLFGPRLSALIKPDDANAQQAPQVADPAPLSMSRQLGDRNEKSVAAPAAAANAALQPRELLPGGVETTSSFDDNLMLTPPSGAAAKRSTKPKR